MKKYRPFQQIQFVFFANNCKSAKSLNTPKRKNIFRTVRRRLTVSIGDLISNLLDTRIVKE